jgi:hypothetical protein
MRMVAGTTNRVAVPSRQAGNRFLGSLKGLQTRALVFELSKWPSDEMSSLTFLLRFWLQYIAKSLSKGRGETVKFVRPSNMVCLLIEIYWRPFWNVLESIHHQFWRHLQYTLEVLPYVFTLTAWKFLKVKKKTRRGSYLTEKYLRVYLSKYFNSNSRSSPFKMEVRKMPCPTVCCKQYLQIHTRAWIPVSLFFH